MKRVVITGMGVVTSLGTDVDTLWNNLLAKKHGFSAIEGFDTSDFDVKYAAEIKNWDPEVMGIPKKDARRMDLFTQFACVAANQAIADASGFADDLDPFRIGVIMGSGIGGFRSIETEHTKYLEKGPNRVSVFFIPMMISNMAGGRIAIDHGFKGENFCPVSACASSNHAVGEAFRKIKHGYLDACVAGGAEAAITEFSLGGFNNMGALSKSTDPDRLSIPFDAERGGFVMGEGSAVLILEEYEHAKKRGAKIYAEIVGYGATDDAFHITSPDASGMGSAKSMEFACNEAGITPAQVDYLNAHGTSTELNDQCETMAVKITFGEAAAKLAISSTKSMTGHLLGAAGALESIICAKALQEGILPPTAGYQKPDPECDLDYITEGPRKKDALYALSNSLGFGGHNATLAFKKYTGE
ncbi:beta-ketoacyl-ACP synthase II [Oscillospiraceae bacterium MB08-C2-2]|nr:beta-ketoacyl-ACP synthase II [Oscillospiraceae bacterium MB08-C2-2]